MLQNEPFPTSATANSTATLSREETLQRDKDIAEHSSSIIYSKRYSDDLFEYRHVILPKPLSKWVPQCRLMAEEEWRALGVTQSPGWVHYMVHLPEPHILLFRRDKDLQQKYPPA
jgi:cyclin-dependent kinase regulatory subunit CKS1